MLIFLSYLGSLNGGKAKGQGRDYAMGCQWLSPEEDSAPEK